VQIIAEAATGEEALRLCRELAPDLVVMDLRLADVDGLRVTRQIRDVSAHTRVLLHTMYESAEYAAEAEDAGAAGYLLKGSSRAEVVQAIRHALGTHR
jgi:DNA-binding NarL/FixJ family response regulator